MALQIKMYFRLFGLGRNCTSVSSENSGAFILRKGLKLLYSITNMLMLHSVHPSPSAGGGIESPTKFGEDLDF